MYTPNKFREGLEIRIRKWAKSIEKDYKLPRSFTIIVEQDKGNKVPEFDSEGRRISWHYDKSIPEYQRHAHIYNGQIVLTFPWTERKDKDGNELTDIEQWRKVSDILKDRIRRVFTRLSNPILPEDFDLLNPTVVSDTMIELVPGKIEGTYAWKRKKFDPFLVNGRRIKEFEIKIETTKKVLFIHKKTGISYGLIDYDNRQEWDLKQECWIKCSELVEIEERIREAERQRTLPLLLSDLDWIKELKYKMLVKEVYSTSPELKKRQSIFSQWKFKGK